MSDPLPGAVGSGSGIPPWPRGFLNTAPTCHRAPILRGGWSEQSDRATNMPQQVATSVGSSPAKLLSAEDTQAVPSLRRQVSAGFVSCTGDQRSTNLERNPSFACQRRSSARNVCK